MQTLNQLAPGGEITHANIQDSAIAWQVFTFAKMLTVPRTLIINDDLSGFSEIPQAFAQMSERACSDLVYATLISNPSSFFSVGNGNTQTGGTSPLSSASLKTAILQLRKQTGPNGSPLNNPPATLIVPPALEQTAKELLHSAWQFRDQTSDRQMAGNSFANIVNLEVEARLELGCTSPISGSTAQTGSATRWYLTSTADRLPAIMGFLKTGNGPIIETAGPDYNFSSPGLSVRVLLDAGFALGDYRAMQHSAGA